MKLTLPTTINHGFTHEDGTKRDIHCCGCWTIIITDQEPWPVRALCNECGEHRDLDNNLEDIH